MFLLAARRSAAVLLLASALASATHAAPRPGLDLSAAARPSAASRATHARMRSEANLQRLGSVSSWDERYDVPTMLWAAREVTQPRTTGARQAQATVESAARRHLGRVAGYYRLAAGDVAAARLQAVHDNGRGGIIASFRQEVGGVEVFRDEVKVLMDRDLGLLAVSGYLPGSELLAAAPPDFVLDAEQATGTALSDFAGLPVALGSLRAGTVGEGGYQTLDASALDLPDPLQPSLLRAKRVLFHMPDALVPAWYVEVMSSEQAASYVVSAEDGTLLFRRDLMAFDAFNYRVYAETSGARIPHDGPQGTAPSPHPTGSPDFYNPSFVAPVLINLQNGPISTNDPWLAPGATLTNGNNVNAYADLFSPDGFQSVAGDIIASTTSANTFDRTYDHNANANASSDQRMASVTQLFYNNNFFHDWYYDHGFNEAAGNAQSDNYGRGGIGGDPLKAESQDYGGTNNANMSTPSDGASPRMQMYVFTPSGSKLTVTAPSSIAGDFATGVASGFGAQTFNLSGTLILGVDATAPVNDGCSALTNAASIAGKIVVLDRGVCAFSAKAQAAQTAGAIGCILVDNATASSPPGLGGTLAGLTIPVLSVTLATGNTLKTAMAAGTVTVTMLRQASVTRDGSLDNHIVAHEWGHYISNRLVGNAAGLNTNMAGGLGEGWADFHSLLMTVRAEDILVGTNANWAGVYTCGAYALTPSTGLANAYYYGVRRVPYSTDFTKNALTFKHIQNGIALPSTVPTAFGQTGSTNAEVHNTGEVWCSMLWECYASLLRDSGRLTFAEAQSRMKDYLVAGYKLTPNSPTLLEARDALLAAVYARNLTDFGLFWAAFARRGAGSGAVAPNRFDANNTGVVESFVTGADLKVVARSISPSLRDCDSDGYLDNEETGALVIQVLNNGSATLLNTSVTVSCTNANITFPQGPTYNLPYIQPFQTGTLSIPVTLTGAPQNQTAAFTITYSNNALSGSSTRVAYVNAYVNVDAAPAANESFETLAPLWTAATATGGGVWTYTEASATDHRANGEDYGDISDHSLTSPAIGVSPTATAFTVSVQHVYDFEKDTGGNYDGGVIEVSSNNGATWTDMATYNTANGYGGTLYTGSGNPISGRSAFVGQSAGYPSLLTSTYNLGTAFNGQTVRLRFRIGTDAGVGATGWQIAAVTLGGIVGTPFTDIGPELDPCAPLAVGPTAPRTLEFALAGGNPTRGGSRLRLGMPRSTRVEAGVFDVTGRRVATLASGELEAGWHDLEWNRNDDGALPTNGVYFARVSADGRTLTTRVVVLR